jgi:hypothetical protein
VRKTWQDSHCAKAWEGAKKVMQIATHEPGNRPLAKRAALRWAMWTGCWRGRATADSSFFSNVFVSFILYAGVRLESGFERLYDPDVDRGTARLRHRKYIY